MERYVILNQRLRNVSEKDMLDTAIYKFDKYYTAEQLGNRTKDQFSQEFINKTTKQKTPVGSFTSLSRTGKNVQWP